MAKAKKKNSPALQRMMALNPDVGRRQLNQLLQKAPQAAPPRQGIVDRLQAQNPQGSLQTQMNPVTGIRTQSWNPNLQGGIESKVPAWGGTPNLGPGIPSNPLPPDFEGGLPGIPSGGSGGPYTGAPGGSGPYGLPSLFSQGLPNAQQGVINSYNTAANRLRERIDSASAAETDQAQRFNLGRGFGNSGAQTAAARDAAASGKFAYGQGLSDLANRFEDQRMKGVESDRTNANFMDQTLFNLINSREGRGSDWNIANLNADTQKQLASMGYKFEGGQSEQNRELQRMLEELRQQNLNYRDSLSGGFNSPIPSLVNNPSFASPSTNFFGVTRG